MKLMLTWVIWIIEYSFNLRENNDFEIIFTFN